MTFRWLVTPNNVGVHLFVQNRVIGLVILFFIIRPHLTSPTHRLGTSCFWALAVCISVHLIDRVKDLSCIHHTDVHSPAKLRKQLKICVRFVVSVVSVQIKVQHLRSGRMCRFHTFIDICCMLWLLYFLKLIQVRVVWGVEPVPGRGAHLDRVPPSGRVNTFALTSLGNVKVNVTLLTACLWTARSHISTQEGAGLCCVICIMDACFPV